MSLNYNELSLSKLNGIYVGSYLENVGKKYSIPLNLICSFNRNIENFGYTLSQEAFDSLCFLTIDEFNSICEDSISALKSLVGSPNYKVFYPNFPEQVMDASDTELYFNAFIHYFTSQNDMKVSWTPEYQKKERSPLKDNIQLKILNLVTYNDVEQYFQNLMSSRTSISESDMKNIVEYVSCGKFSSKIPQVIFHKEILATVVASTFPRNNHMLNNATDVLRVITVLSGGDVSLAQKTKFKSISRSSRRELLKVLDSFPYQSLCDDMVERYNSWIRVGEILHPAEYKQFKNINKVFSELRNGNLKTFNSKIENSYLTEELLNTIKVKPGVFARKLDSILRKYEGTELILKEFENVVDKISTPVLLQLRSHFQNRRSNSSERLIFPKGKVAKFKLISAISEELPKNNVVEIIENSLKNRFSKLPSMGNIYISPEMENIIVPFSERSASKQLKTVTRGSKLKVNATNKTLRFFTWWHELRHNRVDIDLAVNFYDSQFNIVSSVSYFALRNNFSCHSGDIVSAPNGASEFVDVDLQKCHSNVKYIAMVLRSFNNVSFNNLKEFSSGVMVREHMNSGEIYDPRTVELKFDVTSGSKIHLPLFYDVESDHIVWCDMSIANDGFFGYIHSSSGNSSSEKLIKGMNDLTKSKTTFADLILLHAVARKGRLVHEKEKADMVFSLNEGITPFDVAKIASEFLV